MEQHNNTREQIGNDLIIPVAALIFAIYYFSTIWDLEWEAKANGLAIGIALIALVLLYFARVAVRLARGRAVFRFGGLFGSGSALRQRSAIVALIIAFIAVIPHLGFTLSVFVFLISAMLVLGTRRPATLLKVALPVAAGGYLLFIALLATPLPHGPVERLLAALF